jgi:hypothetical protein
MKFIDDPSRPDRPCIGMCVISSPYREAHAQFLKEAASYDIDGVFFDGFYLNGIPHPGKPGCVCEHCARRFNEDTGLDIPMVVDWTDDTFKRWVRWRNHQLVNTAIYFRDTMREANPDLYVTANYNIWPFGNKDWETGIPSWRTSDYGVSQHAYTGAPQLEWIMLGFKSRVSHDINPAHCDIWRSSMYAFKRTGPYTDADNARQELAMKTFMLAGTTYGVTPWHGGHIKPAGAGRRIHEAVRKREHTMSHDALRHVGVILSQNTHDFYGHIPDTDNLTLYRDGILGTWMMLTEAHIPFNFIFDNEVEQGSFGDLKVIVLPNAACLSSNASSKLRDWVKGGGHLVATGDTSFYDEWGNRRERLSEDFGLDPVGLTEQPERAVDGSLTSATKANQWGSGRATYFPFEPGVAWARERNIEMRDALLDAIAEVPPPISYEAPTSLVCNAFWGEDRRTVMVQMLNVSAYMPGGDTGFRGISQPPQFTKPTASDADQEIGDGSGVRVNIPAEDVRVIPRSFQPSSARLVITEQVLEPDADGAYTIPLVDDHEVLVLDI